MPRAWSLVGSSLTALAVVTQGVPTRPAAPAASLASDGRGVVAGRVADGTTGDRLVGVVVTLSLVRAEPMDDQATTSGDQRVLVDDEGNFVFSGLRAGTYTLRAEKPGFTEGAYGRRYPGGLASLFALREGQLLANLPIILWQQGSIEGSVVDEIGEPVTAAELIILRRRTVGSWQQFSRVKTVFTDDRGAFRATGLEPDDYLVYLPWSLETYVRTADAGRNASGVPAVGPATRVVGTFLLQPSRPVPAIPNPEDPDSILVYEPTTQSAPLASTEVRVVAVGPGEHRTGVDLHLRLVLGRRVHGMLVGPNGPEAAATVALVPGGVLAATIDPSLPRDVARAHSDVRGEFVMLAVPPGTYGLRIDTPARADRAPLWTNETVTVGTSGAANMRVALHAGFQLRGRIEFTGGTRPSADQIARTAVRLVAADPDTATRVAPRMATASADGTFTLYAAPGRYLVRGDPPPGWSLNTATLGDKDVADAPLALTQDDIAGIVVRFTARQTNVSGTVRDARGMPDADAVVLAFPSTPGAWKDAGLQPRRMRIARVDDAGAFSISGLPPGDYALVGIEEPRAGAWQAPAFLERLLPSASRISLADGSTVVVTLTRVSPNVRTSR